MKNKEVIEKIKKLFAVAHNEGASDAEAQAAMLKAQRLMVKYNITIEYSDDEEIVYERVSCATPGNKKFRLGLAQVVASNFRCQHYLSNEKVCFFGREGDASIAQEAFEYAYKYAVKEAGKLYRLRLKETGSGMGVANSYYLGFVTGLKSAFDEQCTALMIITPQDVVQEFNNMTKGWKTQKNRLSVKQADTEAYNAGHADGSTVLRGKQLNA